MTQHIDQTSITHERSIAQRIGRQLVLAIPLVLVNLAAIYGQTLWFAANLTNGSYPFAIAFALTIESIAVYLSFEAHSALLAGDAAFRLRIASYGAAGLAATLNFSHFSGPGWQPTTAAIAFATMSLISPWLWNIRSRAVKRNELRAAGLIDQRAAHFAMAKWGLFPIRAFRAFRYSVDFGISAERAAWEAFRDRDSDTLAIVPRMPEHARPADPDGLPELHTKRDYIRYAFAKLGSYEVPPAVAWLAEHGVTVNRNEAYQVRRDAIAQAARESAAHDSTAQLDRLDQPNGNGNGHGNPHELAEVEQS